jgi:hypothetical protein
MRRCRGGKDASASNHWLVRTTGGSIERSTPSLEITMAAAKKKTAKRKSAKKAGAKKGGARKKAAKKGAKKAARRK